MPSPTTKSKKNKSDSNHNKQITFVPSNLIEALDELYPPSEEYKLILNLILDVCKEFPELTNTAYYYLIGKRYRIDCSNSDEKILRAKITEDYSDAYEINRSTVYSYSFFVSVKTLAPYKNERRTFYWRRLL